MKTLVIHSEKQEDIKLFINLAKRFDLRSKILTEAEKEEIGLYNAMVEGRKTKLVSRALVMNNSPYADF